MTEEVKWKEIVPFIEEQFKTQLQENLHEYNKETETKINKINRQRKKNKFKLPKDFLGGK